jgi:hypothetical protein
VISPNDTVYVIKCLDTLDYERFLGMQKTQNLDGVPTAALKVPDSVDQEFIWD